VKKWEDENAGTFLVLRRKTGNNAFVPIQAATIVVTAENKAYVNVTIPENVKGAKVFAAQEQKVGFVKLFGINGVMINGELAEEFVIPDSVIPEAN
jgi:hypothetical protein